MCKPSSKPDDTHTSNPSGDAAEGVPGHEAGKRVFTDEELSRTDGKEYVIEMPDVRDSSQTMRLSSKTLSPVVLRDVRDCVKARDSSTLSTSSSH